MLFCKKNTSLRKNKKSIICYLHTFGKTLFKKPSALMVDWSPHKVPNIKNFLYEFRTKNNGRNERRHEVKE